MGHKFKLGQKARNIVNGSEGIVNSRTEHINGCVQYGLSLPVDKDGKYVEGYQYDEQVLVLVDEGILPLLELDPGDPDTPEVLRAQDWSKPSPGGPETVMSRPASSVDSA